MYELHEAYQKMEETQKSSQNFEIISPTIEERKVFSPKLKKSISCVEDVKSSYQTDKVLFQSCEFDTFSLLYEINSENIAV